MHSGSFQFIRSLYEVSSRNLDTYKLTILVIYKSGLRVLLHSSQTVLGWL